MHAASAPELHNLAEQRAFYGKWNDNRLAEMRRHFRTVERRQVISGVPVDVVTPAGGVPAGNRLRVLINIHGGGFMWGAGSGALVEAIPIAATGGYEVVTVDYRLTPEHHYPAASEDVTTVYRALLKHFPARNIGIYGCSAGGIITAQSVAWFRKIGLPRPGAIATLCGTGAPFSGDSPILAEALGGQSPVTTLPTVLPTPYLAGVAATDSQAYPLNSPQETAAFPPTLMLAGSRDFTSSSLTLADRRLAAANVASELHLFDGLPHAFFVWPDLPESQEAYRLIDRFFDHYLGRSRR